MDIAVGQLVRAVRRARRMSQRELAAAAGVPLSTIVRLEADTVMPRVDTLLRVLAGAEHVLIAADRQGNLLAIADEHEHVRDRGGRHFPAHLEWDRLRRGTQWWGWERIAWWDNDPKAPRHVYYHRTPEVHPGPAPFREAIRSVRDTALVSWWERPAGDGFGLQNLPLGVFSMGRGEPRRIGIRYGDWVLDAQSLWRRPAMREPTVNAFLGEGRRTWSDFRATVQDLLSDEQWRDSVQRCAVPLHRVHLHLPLEVADYVDFYASENHASNVGKVGSSRVDLQACKLEYSIVSPK